MSVENKAASLGSNQLSQGLDTQPKNELCVGCWNFLAFTQWILEGTRMFNLIENVRKYNYFQAANKNCSRLGPYKGILVMRTFA